MGTLILGSATEQKGVTVNPRTVLYNGSNVYKIMHGSTVIWNEWDGSTLYDAGNEYDLITGGYSLYNTQTGTFTKNATNMTASISGAKRCYADTTNPIDLTDYNTIFFRGYGTDSSTYNDTGTVGIVSNRSKNNIQQAGNYDINKWFTNSTAIHTISLDISALSGLYYVRFGVCAGVSCNRLCYIDKIWLE